MTTKPITQDHNATTGEVTVREMTDAEFAQYQIDMAAGEAKLIAIAQDATNKTSLLAKLGITEEEAKLLLN